MTLLLKISSACLRSLALAGHFALLIAALAAAAASGGLGKVLILFATIGFVVVNARILFPWPQSRHDLRGSFRFARRSLWMALSFALLFCAAGLVGIGSFRDWLAVFLILGMTSSLNLLALRLLAQPTDREK